MFSTLALIPLHVCMHNLCDRLAMCSVLEVTLWLAISSSHAAH